MRGCVPVCVSLFAIALSAMQSVSGDPAEGSRLLEEAFRDYDKRIRPSFGGSPVNVNVSMYIISVSDVDALSMTYTMTFFIRQIWNDPRLSFNSRRNIDTITLDGASSERIWTPDTFFVNVLSSVNHDALVNNEFCRISQDGMILFSRKVTVTAYSPMSLLLFPYDRHKLTLELESYGSQTKDLGYVWTKDVSVSKKPIPGFSMAGIGTKDATKTTATGSYSILTLEIYIKRNPLPYELGLVLPTFLLVAMCLGGLHFRGKSVLGTAISIFSVSAMLILYGQVLLNFARNGGRNSPYLTPLHLYMLLSTCFGFLCLVFNLKHNTEKSTSSSELGETEGNKSRTESTSEDCKLEEFKSEAISSTIESRPDLGIDTTVKDKQNIWKRIKMRFHRKSRSECYNFVIAALWGTLILGNAIFIFVFRCLQ